MADNQNPYLAAGADAVPQQSPYMAAPVGADNGASRFSPAPADADFLRTQPVNGNDGGQWNSSNIANQQDQNADSAGAQVGDTIPLMDGTAVEYTAELQGLMGQFHQSIESQLGKGTVDAMLQYAGTLDAGTQATLERMVLSGDPAQMQRAVQYLQERMASGSTAGYVPSQGNPYGQPAAQPVGMSHAEFIAAYDALNQWAAQTGRGAGTREYDQQYHALVAQRSAGKRAGR
ncbi:TPA: hypothetical protein ACP2TQ_000509 [Escherichia coli]|uniref:hypothetical protein n=1 Tax=Cronobacter sakazakii TaxID=28141 RepID=UPI000CFB9B10|nr:hypothetical protein [Cronobacter sakazakii]EGT4441920.1 hypothetical protein [Cronobacter sakazakii]EGT5706341.1 hypothetical protein [Cronobacter sakazakii]EJG0807954.1 hypothetical protein [Cronobacter sakazakii]EKY2077153.1 hypothetical protein [Cronobacter sakazakii]ELY3451301.1 hypothetical protein [Cronobacter sakazakii]